MDLDQGCGYIDFEEAYHLYSSFGQFFCPDKQAFRNKLLDEIHGLPVYVITQPITCKIFVALASVVQRPDNFIRWIRHFPASKIYFTLNVFQGFRTLPN